jgi:hypothetical protein
LIIFKNRNAFLTVLEAAKFKMKVPADGVSCEGCSLISASLLCPHMAEEASIVSSHSREQKDKWI